MQDAKKDHFCFSLSNGISTLMNQCTVGAMYYATARLLYEYPNKVNPTNMWIALFCILFGVLSSGNAKDFGADVAASHDAAIKVFTITETPSDIDALATVDPACAEIVQIKDETFRGEIEFRDVWFRYPTRRDQWIFKGLNLKIN